MKLTATSKIGDIMKLTASEDKLQRIPMNDVSDDELRLISVDINEDIATLMDIVKLANDQLTVLKAYERQLYNKLFGRQWERENE